LANNSLFLNSEINSFIIPILPNLLNLPKWRKINNSIFPETNCTSIVVWNNYPTIGSTLGLIKFSNYIRDITYIPTFHLSILVGLLLSDAGLSKQKNSKNARLGFKQSMNHFPFFWSTFMLLSHFCSSIPYQDNAKLNGKLYYGIRMDTRSYSCLSELHELFYTPLTQPNDKIIYKKIVPSNIYNLLTPVALAYWIMGDGLGNIWKGLYLCTDSFSDYDIIKLMNVLLIRYNINSKLVKISGKSRIYIPSTESAKINNLVLEFMHPSMLYKILGNYPLNVKKDLK
jgi:hypothetical protein